MTPDRAIATQTVATAKAMTARLAGTQALHKSTPTPLPDIPATPNERTPSPLGVTATELHELQLSLWYPWTGGMGAGFQALVDEFNRNNQWGITVKATGYNGFGALDDAMETALTTGALPDVLADYGYQGRAWNEIGVLADLAPYVNDPVWGITSDEQADFYPGFWKEDLTSTGITPQPKRVGIPYYRSAYVLFYNQSWAKDLGYAIVPATPEDFRVQACAAAEAIGRQGDKSALGKGGWLVTPEPGALLGWIYAFGGGITNQDGTDYQINTPQTLQAFNYLKSLQASGCAWLDESLDARAEFANRQALFIVGSTADLTAQQAALNNAGSTDDWLVIPFPSNSQPVVDTYGSSLLMTTSSPARQLAAWLVIKWLVYPPNQAEFLQQFEAYPTRKSTLDYLSKAAEEKRQLVQAWKLLPDARSEPSLTSWSIMRWAFHDASIQLFSTKLLTDQIPELIGNLDSLAQDVNNQAH